MKCARPCSGGKRDGLVADFTGKRGLQSGRIEFQGISPDLRLAALCLRGVSQAKRVTNLVFRFATVQGQNIQWFLRRNCSISPRQLGLLYASLCLLSLGIGIGFWFQGAKLILPFAWLELMVVGVAFLVYARHATDGERILLTGPHLVVELERAGKLGRWEFRREWVRVEPRTGDGSLIHLSAQGQSIDVGRYVRPELRPLLAQEIRQALRA